MTGTPAVRPPNVVIETPQLWMRGWSPDDADGLRPLVTDPDMMRYIGEGRPWTDEMIAFFIDRERKRQARVGFCLWALIERASGEIIGQCGLKHIGETDYVEMGWWVARKLWGRGLATEAALAVRDAAFARHGLERIVAIAHPNNAASVRVMEKIGMRFHQRMMRADLGLVKQGKPDGPIVMYLVDAPVA